MDLYILRHGIAVERGTPGFTKDADRPLTPEGKQKLRKITRALRVQELSFDLVLSSPYVRARETAERVAAVLGRPKQVRLTDSLIPDGSFRELVAELKALRPAPKRPLLVGHEPYLSSLIALLVTGSPSSCITLKKGGICKLTAETLRPGRCATLEWLLTPRQMLLMG
jgi:phosphohistidine phosphatase